MLALAFAAARPFLPGLGVGHGPTAVAIVLDNSLSTTAVVGGRQVFDRLKDAARQLIDAVDAGRSSLARHRRRSRTRRLPRCAARRARAHRAVGGGGDLTRALGRAAASVRDATLPSRGVAVATDAQRTAWATAVPVEMPFALFVPNGVPPQNRARPRCIGRSRAMDASRHIAARVETRDSVGFPRRARRSHARARRDRPRRADRVARRVPPSADGRGRVELEPDDFPADDARHFALWIGPPPAVVSDQSAGPFAATALSTLVADGRATSGSGAGASIRIASADVAGSLPALIVPPPDAVRLGAANRELERLNIPWRFGGIDVRRPSLMAVASMPSPCPSATSSSARASLHRTRSRRRAGSRGSSAVRATCSSARVSIPRRRSFPCALPSCPGWPTCSLFAWVHPPATWALRSTHARRSCAPPRRLRVAGEHRWIASHRHRGDHGCAGGARRVVRPEGRTSRRCRRGQRATRGIDPRSHDSHIARGPPWRGARQRRHVGDPSARARGDAGPHAAEAPRERCGSRALEDDSSGGALTTTAPTRRPPRRTNQTPRSSGASMSSAVTERRDPPVLSSDSEPAGRCTGRRAARRSGCRRRRRGAPRRSASMSASQGTNGRAHRKLRRRGIEARADEHVARAGDDPRLARRGRERVGRRDARAHEPVALRDGDAIDATAPGDRRRTRRARRSARGCRGARARGWRRRGGRRRAAAR